MSSVAPQFGKTAVETYKHSGRVPVSGLILSLVVLVPIAVLLGAIYSGAVVWVPFIKLRGLLTCFYGGAIGGIVGTVCRAMKFRSTLFVSLMTLLIVAISYYASWASHQAFVIWRFDGMSDDVTASAIAGFLPQNIYEWASYIHDNGLWAMGKNGNAMSGIGVCVLWAVELLTILGVAWVSRATYGTAPFCENCNQWTQETRELAELPVSPDDPAWQKFAAGDLDAVKRLQVVQNVPQYVELQLAACGTCQESDYVSAVGITLVTDKEGEITKKEDDIVRHLHISRAQRDELQQFAVMMAEAVDAMDEETDEELKPYDPPQET
ncbi:hypothetical protein [Planctomycetes bacterium K23_9]|uniref:Uncharacterized protein n=1 Tax=Stieleria marina TaxID=1930275 RepID=A0A517NT98_9BACT|nr:hypothetical protein K239x_23060 [Planctomycetes bacterium K23_9]